MVKASGKDILGKWAFFIGFILAIVLGLLGPITGTWLIVLVIIGLLVGLLNIGDKEVTPFLMSGIALIIASALGGTVMSSVDVISSVLDALLVVFVPATVIVAIKNIFTLARD